MVPEPPFPDGRRILRSLRPGWSGCSSFRVGGDDGFVDVEGRDESLVDDRAFVAALSPVGNGAFHLGFGPFRTVRAELAGDGDEVHIGQDAHVELVVLQELYKLRGTAAGELLVAVA